MTNKRLFGNGSLLQIVCVRGTETLESDNDEIRDRNVCVLGHDLEIINNLLLDFDSHLFQITLIVLL